MTQHDFYTIVDGEGNQVTTGVHEHEVERVAQRCADRLGLSVWASDDDEKRGTRYDPAVLVEASNPTPSGCLPGGIDVDVTARLGEVEFAGEATLCRDRINGGWVAYGDAADTWVESTLLHELVRRCADLREVLSTIEAAAVAQVTNEVAEQADAAGAAYAEAQS